MKNIFTDISMPDNLFKVPDSLLEICNIIHRDSEDENPKIVAPDTTIHMLIRQYDPSLLLTIDRNTLLYRLEIQTLFSTKILLAIKCKMLSWKWFITMIFPKKINL